MKRTIFVSSILLLFVHPIPVLGQAVFRSTQSANLPTAATVGSGAFLFEISHRFNTPISRGSDAFWGLDGPVINRLGLSYGVHRRVMLSVLRSNLQDNLEINARVGGILTGSSRVPVELGAQGGIAWNTQASSPVTMSQAPTLPGVEA